jgi:hypothetical protein
MQAIADANDYQLIVNQNYANTGEFRFEKAQTFHPALRFSYSFQSSYASFDGGIKRPYVETEKLGDIVQHVREWLTPDAENIFTKTEPVNWEVYDNKHGLLVLIEGKSEVARREYEANNKEDLARQRAPFDRIVQGMNSLNEKAKQ